MKKKSGLFNKLIYWVNLLVAILLLISFVLPYVPPQRFPTLSLLSLAVFPLIIINFLFVIYWIFKLKLKLLLSAFILVIAHFHFGSFIQFSSDKDNLESKNSISVLSYNVRLFNAYQDKSDQDSVPKILSEIIESNNPEIICIQEYYSDNQTDLSAYPFQFIHYKEKNKLGHAIFSKYPLINTGSFEFEKTYNNSIYADVIKGKDTVRVYNLHLNSLGILPSVSFLQEGDKEKFRKRISNAFTMQEQQTVKILEHKKNSNHPVLLCGDFNNTSFSYVYKNLSEEMNDAFIECGNGIGTTYLFDSFPMRIDYILASQDLEIVQFETIKKTFSDHYPVSAKVNFK